MAYSMEFRRAVARRYDECGSSDQAAEELGCSGSWVRRLIQRRGLTDSLEPLPPKRPDTSKLTDADLDHLRGLIASRPDLTLAELAAELDDKVSVPTVWRATQRLGLPLKKSPSVRPSRTGRT
jgi:transposase